MYEHIAEWDQSIFCRPTRRHQLLPPRTEYSYNLRRRRHDYELIAKTRTLFHDLLLRSYLYHCVWIVITAHNLTPPSNPTTCLRNNIKLITGISPCCGCLYCILKHTLVLRLVGLVPHSSVSLLLEFSAMLSVSLVSQVTATSLHDNMLGVNRHLASGHEISRLQHGLQLIMARYTRIINCRPCCNLHFNTNNFIIRKNLCYTKTVIDTFKPYHK